MSRLTLRRLSYYVAVIGFGVAVHQESVAGLVGSAIEDFLRRNSEAYALAVLVPASWDLAAWGAHPADRPGVLGRRAMRVDWLVLLIAAAATTQSSAARELLGLPQAIITLGEAFVATVVIALYLWWTRRRPSDPTTSTRTVRASWWYYGAVALLIALSYQSIAVTLLGGTTVEWLQVNAEATAAMLLIPVYFDFVAPRGRSAALLAWYLSLVAIPLLVASGSFDDTALASVTGWLARTTEVFLAALAITTYFTWWRDSGHVSPPEVSNGVD